MELVPGDVPHYLRDDQIKLLYADERVFEAMLVQWRTRLTARNLSAAHIKTSSRVVLRLQEHSNEYPWSWQPHHFEEFIADLRSADPPAALSTVRGYTAAIRGFMAYVSEPRNGWISLCARAFGAVPAQIVFDWNAPRRTTEDDLPTDRRALTREELQRLFDAADDLVEAEHARGSKRWLPALRDSTALKVAYAYGLRRQELTRLETIDFGPNPKVPGYGDYGALQVRWGKATKGSGPRRRTVLTVPEFDWIIAVLEHWNGSMRAGFPTAKDSLGLWPSERSTATTLRTFERAFTRSRDQAGLAPGLTLHCLRHSYVTHLIEAGYDPFFVQQQVGHRHASTTSLYTSVGSDFKQRVVQRMIAKRLQLDEEGTGGHD